MTNIDKENIFTEILGDQHFKYRKYTVEFKLKVINLIESGLSLHMISDKLNIDRKVLRDWCNKKDYLLDVQNKNTKFRCHRDNEDKKIFSNKQEEEIKNWIIDIRKKHLPLSTKTLISFAGKLNHSFEEKKIKAKLRWAYRFLKRLRFYY